MKGDGLGFTLLELLVVLGIVGLLAVGGLASYRKARIRSEVASAQVRVAQALQMTRSAVWRYNVDGRIAFPDDRTLQAVVADGSQSYFVETYTLPTALELHYSTDGVNWRAPSTMSALVYRAPFAEIGASPRVFRVRRSDRPEIEACVRVIGVTGKVVSSRACP